ncbi:MAG: hypothetical protein AAF492_20755, partial [Verrucomicrobiota bacterium]
SSFLAASDIAGAGEIQARDGTVTAISNKSGHYHPRMEHLAQTLIQLKEMDQNLSTVDVNIYGKTGTNARGNDVFDVRPFADKAGLLLDLYLNRPSEFLDRWIAMGFFNYPYDNVELGLMGTEVSGRLSPVELAKLWIQKTGIGSGNQPNAEGDYNTPPKGPNDVYTGPPEKSVPSRNPVYDSPPISAQNLYGAPDQGQVARDDKNAGPANDYSRPTQTANDE